MEKVELNLLHTPSLEDCTELLNDLRSQQLLTKIITSFDHDGIPESDFGNSASHRSKHS